MGSTLVKSLVLLALVVGLLFLLPDDDHVGYAAPVRTGLPSQLVIGRYVYRDPYTCDERRCRTVPDSLKRLYPRCETRAFLQQHTAGLVGTSRWPLRQMGAIPTLFRAAHPIVVFHPILVPTESYETDALLINVVYVEDGNCYAPYFLAG